MKWVRRLLVVSAVVFLLLLGRCGYLRFAPNEWLLSAQFREANQIIAQIEDFRATSGHYPESLSALGIKESEEGTYYYRLYSEKAYIVWFGGGRGFFSCQTYDSKTGTWAEAD